MLSNYMIVVMTSISLLFSTPQTTQVTSLVTTAQYTTIKNAQQQLQQLDRYHWPIDERNSIYMQDSLKKLQRDYRLAVNGKLDNKTKLLLQQLTTLTRYQSSGQSSTTAKQKVVITAKKHSPVNKVHKGNDAITEEVHLLAKAVHSEARGEPYKGKVAVAAVILNRTEAKGFPRTIKGVIYQPRAFTAVSDGQFGLTPSKSAYQAARAALRGSDPTGGAIFYFNPETATSGWMFEEAKKHRTTKIGKHVFFRS